MAGTVITKKGLQLIAKLVASGTALTFTRVSVGTGSVPAGYDPGSMTDLNNYKMDGSISSCSFLGDEASIIMQISSLGVENGFTITETGLFATDPDEGEILYSYLDLSKDPQYVYEENSAISKFVEMTLVVKVGTVERVTAQLNPHSLLTRDGDISDTSINELEPIDTKYPVPSAGESTKVFMGKVKKYIEDTKPLDADMTVYVATTGSDTTGDGTSSKPYKTITYALSKIPKVLYGFTASIVIAEGSYDESLEITGYSGDLQLLIQGDVTITKGVLLTNSEVSCRSSDGNIRTLTSKWFTVLERSRWDSRSTVDIVTTGIYSVGSHNVSLYASVNCLLYMSGTVTMAGNTDIGAYIVSSSQAHFGIIMGTGFNIGIFTAAGGKVSCSRNAIIASTEKGVVDNGSILVNRYGATIGTLRYDVNLYVATTGSDTTGDGTSVSPYRTIQYALNTLPKDLGSFGCTIVVASGTYNEDVNIRGFHNGSINLYSETQNTLSTSCNVLSILVGHCTGYVRINGFNLTSTTKVPITVFSTDGAYIYYCQCTFPTSSINGINCYESKVGIEYCKMTGKDTALMASFSTVISNNWYSSSGNNYGIYSLNGSRITTNGSQPSGINGNFIFGNGGMYVNNSGTQITDLISTGLSCTWGTLQGGYVRHGNLNGRAMITIQLRVQVITTLSAGLDYVITGFPTTYVDTAVSCNNQYNLANLYLNTQGILVVRLITTRNPGDVLVFNCTYRTTA